MVQPTTDQALVAQALEGHREAFEALMRAHNPRVYRVVRSVLRGDSEVEDAMQDAYVHAFSHLAALTGEFGPWLRRIAFHEALGRTRRARASPFEAANMNELDPPSPVLSPESEAARAQMHDALEAAVDALPEAFRQVFMLRAVDGCSVAETAQLLGVHEETVKSRLHRARGRLQAQLAAWADHELPRLFSFQAPRCDRVVGSVLARLRVRPEQ